MHKVFIILLSLATAVSLAGENGSLFENPADYPYLGDWEGQWINPEKGHEKNHPEIAAQLICLDNRQYRIRILPKLYIRSEPYLDTITELENGKIDLNIAGWQGTIKGETFTGTGILYGDRVNFEMKKVEKLSPTLGLKPPKGAVHLFDGEGFEHWIHADGREVTWKQLEGVMEVVSGFWNNGKNRQNGIGGDIKTKRQFGDMQFHMEFRYAVEPERHGEGRGNSGLFFIGIGEVQILNSYGSDGFWNECGAVYKIWPPHVNAARPPLQWQSYDIELRLPKFDGSGQKIADARITVRHNGTVIHHQTPVPSEHRGPVAIALQDHNNPIQFRNIWVKELK